jgi:hypothetical protein
LATAQALFRARPRQDARQGTRCSTRSIGFVGPARLGQSSRVLRELRDLLHHNPALLLRAQLSPLGLGGPEACH